MVMWKKYYNPWQGEFDLLCRTLWISALTHCSFLIRLGVCPNGSLLSVVTWSVKILHIIAIAQGKKYVLKEIVESLLCHQTTTSMCYRETTESMWSKPAIGILQDLLTWWRDILAACSYRFIWGLKSDISDLIDRLNIIFYFVLTEQLKMNCNCYLSNPCT